MHSRSRQAGDQMRRQLAKQHKQQEQEQEQQANRFRSAGRELPAKQDQTQHNPVAESQPRESFTSDQ